MKENLQEPNSHAAVGHAGCARKLLNAFSVVPLSLDFGVFDVLLCFFFFFWDSAVLCSCYHSSGKQILNLTNSLQLFFYPMSRYGSLLIAFVKSTVSARYLFSIFFLNFFSVKILVVFLVRLIEKSTCEHCCFQNIFV